MNTKLIFRLLLLAACCWQVAFTAAAQQRVDLEEWPRATIITAEGDTLTGKVVYYHEDEILQLTEADGTVSTLTPVLVQSFYVPDPKLAGARLFRTYLWNRGNDYNDFKSPGFFEQLSIGPYALLEREVVRQDLVRNDPFYGGMGSYNYGYGGMYNPRYSNPQWVTRVQELFYVYTPKGKIYPLRNNPKKDLLFLLRDKEKQIKAFVNDQNLRYNRKYDLIKILGYYNSLLDPAAAQQPQTDKP